jgi:Ca2+-binding EF-hand superfamily protein
VSQYGSAVVFDENALQQLYLVFHASADHQLTHDAFVATMGNAGTPPNIAHQLFSAMDRDGSGTISFEEMAVGLAVLARGDLRAKLSLAFSAFDVDKNGAFDSVHGMCTSDSFA